jgi:hypothetical protein
MNIIDEYFGNSTTHSSTTDTMKKINYHIVKMKIYTKILLTPTNNKIENENN